MTNAMGPPPVNPNLGANPVTKSADELVPPPPSPHPSSGGASKSVMGPPPPKIPDASKPNSVQADLNSAEGQPQSETAPESIEKSPESSSGYVSEKSSTPKQPQSVGVPYKIPAWGGAPCHEFYLEVLKEGCIIDKLDVYEKGAYMFGRLDLCDFLLEHPTISRFHAVIQFKRSGQAYLYDLGSTHGTFLNKNQVEKNTYIDLHVGDVIKFGRSSRLFIFQGPSNLMLPETDAKIMGQFKMCEQIVDQEASLQRARLEASLADGISWGMSEDAIEEDEDDSDEVTWQSYKGQLTEKQEKTREKITKRMEKIANMKKEINAIRVKDISQGGLTQGQQTQIARNEQRITQMMEELENLEETLNDSIRESVGARSGKLSAGKKKGPVEDEVEYLSDDDEFYDRTKKRPTHQKADGSQSIETADTLLDKKEAIIKEMCEKKELFSIEKNKMPSASEIQDEVGDTLDAYMSGLSSQLVYDKSVQLEKDLSTLQSELDRICYLLKIADPSGEAAKKRELKAHERKPSQAEEAVPIVKKKQTMESQRSGETCAKEDKKKLPAEIRRNAEPSGKADVAMSLDKSEGSSAKMDDENVVYSMPKPQWLGALGDRVTIDSQQNADALDLHEMDVESEPFIDYKDRNKILGTSGDAKAIEESNIESAAPGLILRKRKLVEKSEANGQDASQQLASSFVGPELGVEDAVALLLKHKRGYYASDEERGNEHHGTSDANNKSKRVLGPEKPSFLSGDTDGDAWVPPEGQSGDGRTSLNDKYGY
ncbi:kanadaptin [Neltuma alba]|uniref:kanadaptin n=1 Tax=Neltuma alba TaxID=207710 RepID=UPI0010A2F049|nr:kanadaptin [Prosopis alba]